MTRSTKRWGGAALRAVLLIATCFACGREAPELPRPTGDVNDIALLSERSDINVLFILIDTLRADRLGAYGYHRDTSPAIDSLASSGVRFAHHLSQSSWTKCSMASLWTGLYPARTGVLRFNHAVSPEATMPAEIFSGAGFDTAAIWRNGWVAPNFGFAQGFETYHNPSGSSPPTAVRRENPAITIKGTDNDAMRAAVEFLRTRRDQRWFLYLHLMDVHQYVYDEESAVFGTSYSDMYDSSIRWLDRNLEELLSTLEYWKLRDRTLVVLASDHGEAFGEHGLEGHARNLYGEVTETPFILSFPFRLEPGIVVESRSENVDIWPTILALMGLPPLENVDGRSRLAEIEAAARGTQGTPGKEPVAIAHLDQTWGRTQQEPSPIVALTRGEFRLIHHENQPERVELYALEDDPRESQNVAEIHPEAAADLAAEAERYLEQDAVPWAEGTPTVELDEMLLHQLRALGYKLD